MAWHEMVSIEKKIRGKTPRAELREYQSIFSVVRSQTCKEKSGVGERNIAKDRNLSHPLHQRKIERRYEVKMDSNITHQFRKFKNTILKGTENPYWESFI